MVYLAELVRRRRNAVIVNQLADMRAVIVDAKFQGCDVCRIWNMAHPSGCQRPHPIKLR